MFKVFCENTDQILLTQFSPTTYLPQPICLKPASQECPWQVQESSSISIYQPCISLTAQASKGLDKLCHPVSPSLSLLIKVAGALLPSAISTKEACQALLQGSKDTPGLLKKCDWQDGIVTWLTPSAIVHYAGLDGPGRRTCLNLSRLKYYRSLNFFFF